MQLQLWCLCVIEALLTTLCCLLFQLLLVFQKHKELIRRPTVSKELQSERETLLARLLDYNKGAIKCEC